MKINLELYKNRGVIYKITNPLGYVYIGKTFNLCQRYHNYKSRSCLTQTRMLESLNNFSFDSHTIEIICICDDKINLNDLEFKYISEYKSNFSRHPNCNGLNLTDGGQGVNGYKHTESARAKLSKIAVTSHSTRGRKMSEETKDKIRNSLKGRRHSPERALSIKDGLENRVSLILNINTGVFFNSIREAAFAHHLCDKKTKKNIFKQGSHKFLFSV